MIELSNNIIKGKVLSKAEKRDLFSYVDQILHNLTPAAMKELLGGYGNDLDDLYRNMLQEAYRVTHVESDLIDPEAIDYLPQLETVMDETLKINSFNYFKTTMLPNFDMGWRNIEWGNLTQMYPFSSYQCERGSGKSMEWCFAFPLWRS